MLESSKLLTKDQYERKVSGYKKSKKSTLSKSITVDLPAWFRAYYQVSPSCTSILVTAPNESNFTKFPKVNGDIAYMQLGGKVVYVPFDPKKPDVVPGMHFEFNVPDRVRKTASLGEERVDWEQVLVEMAERECSYKETPEYRGYVEMISGKNDAS
ncbi:hypothetical protein SM033_00124 [Vibrio phage vB_VpaM_sm033]|nr:hypothetical protein SM033_00124 [Vibrio phage vB_VpaM_sm033]